MNERRNKYRQHIEEPIVKRMDIKFDITELNLLCSYVVSNNRSITRSSLLNIRKVLNLINIEDYDNDEMLNMIDFINKVIIARVDKNLTDMNIIVRDVIGGIGGMELSKIPSTHEVNNYEVSWINDNINSILMYSNIRNNARNGIDIMTRLLSENYTTKGDILDDYIKWITTEYNELRRIRNTDNGDMEFSLERDKVIDNIRHTYRELSSVSNTLKFGTTGLNNITGGGLHAKRVYILLGLPGEGKSATLLDMALQIRSYNRNYICKDPTKKPCVVLLTMENDIQETVERMFSMVTQQSIRSCVNENEAIQMFCDAKNMVLSDDNPVNLVIIYKPSLSIDTSFLYDLIDRLDDEGYETMCIFQDYLKKIHAASRIRGSKDDSLRLELGQVVLEFKNIATEKNIPIVTASQLNRDAINNMDNAKIRNRSDLVRLLGRANIAESTLILENADWVCALAKEKDKKDNTITYLGLHRLKSRYHIKSEDAYFMPYIGDSIKLIEDIHMPIALCKTTLTDKDPNMNVNHNTTANGIYVEPDDEDMSHNNLSLFVNPSHVNKIINIPEMQMMNIYKGYNCNNRLLYRVINPDKPRYLYKLIDKKEPRYLYTLTNKPTLTIEEFIKKYSTP